MFAPRLALASLVLVTVVAKVLIEDSKQTTTSSETKQFPDGSILVEEAPPASEHSDKHDKAFVPDEEQGVAPVHDEGDEPAYEAAHVEVSAAHEKATHDEVVHEEAKKEDAKARPNLEQQLERIKEVEHNAAMKLTDGAAATQPIDIDAIDASDSGVETDTIDAAIAVDSPGTSSIEVAFDGSELARRSPVPNENQVQTKSASSIEVAFDGAELARRSPVPPQSVEQPQTQTKSTTEILVHPSGDILVGDLAQTSETLPSFKQRAGTNARRVANAADRGEQHSLPYSTQNTAGSVLRQEKDIPKVEQLGSTTVASSVLRTEVENPTHAKTADAKTADVKSPEFKEIRLATVAQPVMSRSHRIPKLQPQVNVVASTTTTAAALSVAEPEPLGWKHGLIPGILAHLQVQERNIIHVCIVVFLVIRCLESVPVASHPTNLLKIPRSQAQSLSQGGINAGRSKGQCTVD